MTQWPSSKAAKVFRALLRKGYTVKSQKGSHVILTHPERGDYVWAFHDAVEIGHVCSHELQSERDCNRKTCSL